MAQKKSLFSPQVRGKTGESGGDNVYVLDFKRFLPVRKSRCKGMFFCLKDLTGFIRFFFPPQIFSSWGHDGVTEFGSVASQRAENA